MVLPTFPAFTGPFAVGVAEHEWRGAFPPGHADLVPVGDDGPRTAESLLVRVFYPAGAESARALSARSGSGAAWIQGKEAQGYADFLRMPRLLARPLFAGLFTRARLPAAADAPLLRAPDGNGRWPVVVFSHGLGGCRTTYQYFCGDLASRGLVVMAVEHRDRSACISTEHLADGSSRDIEYLRIGWNPPDPDWALNMRWSQVRHRAAEVRRTAALARKLNRGEVPAGFGAETSPAWASFKGALDLDQLVVAGHSFGGATAIRAMQAQYNPSNMVQEEDDDLKWDFKVGLVMDPWLMPVKPDSPISVPTLISSSETFHWRDNTKALATLLSGSSSPSPRTFPHVTLKGTAHQNHSDFPLLLPSLLRRVRMAGPTDPLVAIRRNNAVCVEFLAHHGIHVRAPHYAPHQLGFVNQAQVDAAMATVEVADVTSVGINADQPVLRGDRDGVVSVLCGEHPEVIKGWDAYVEKHGIKAPYLDGDMAAESGASAEAQSATAL